ncbi:hypothetical protein HD806DRAFT_5585 [Xylariaceae sp. AK1471]|nr:hypothetical protein HD806DRAFT_5585 [Xylariaceae sp. AK1471]
MVGSESPAKEPPSLTAQPGAKRRRIRKGTRSCWECKRRKNRCTWSRDEGKCDGCHHRGTRCVGQEFTEEHIPVPHERRGGNKLDDARLSRIETLVAELARKVNAGNRQEDHLELPPDGRSDGNQALIGGGPDTNPAFVSPEPPEVNGFVDLCLHMFSNEMTDDGRMRMTNALQPSLPRVVAGSSLGQFGEVTSKLTPLTHALVAAWPSERHHDAILSMPIANVGSLHPAMSSPCSGFRTPPTPRDLLQLPPPGTEPVAIARKLLTLGTYLQVVSSQSKYDATGPSDAYHDILSRVFETVNRLVTHNDNLPGSVDVIECLITESQYHNYTGNVRRSWIILRRAVAMAQMIGLDHQSKTLPCDTDADGAATFSRQEHVWFLLIHFDQYLSLMLGISPGLPENSQVAPELLERCTPSGRMGRLHSMAAGRILRRNHVNMYDLVETKKIDKILQKAAACMPAQWWLPPDVRCDDCGEKGSSRQIDRLMVHFAHYNILLQLHLPYILLSLSSQRYHYSTTAVINASREVLTRFTAFRSRYPAVSYCSGLDFFAFVASAALCLLHIHESCESQNPSASDSGSISDLLAHQRLTNRGLMERALKSIEKIAQVKPDNTITSDTVPVFRRLLAVEEEASRGVSYSIHSSSNARQPRKSSWKLTNSSDVLYLDIPFCGTIKVERTSDFNTISTELSNSEEMARVATRPLDSFSPSTTACSVTVFPALQAREGHHTAISESYHFDNNHSNSVNAPIIMSSFSNLPAVPYNNDNEAQDSTPTPGLLAPETLGSLEERLNPAIDPGFFECLFDIE